MVIRSWLLRWGSIGWWEVQLLKAGGRRIRFIAYPF
jgi:hypothetical protein